VAARIAIPDVNRSWKLPDAKQDTLELTLPFLIKYREQQSIGGFLFSHYQGHQDVSHGLFSTGSVHYWFQAPSIPLLQKGLGDGGDTAVKKCLFINSKVWLAPFDFGIMQNVHMEFCPCVEEPGFLEIRVRLIRKSGEATAWGRINKAFMNDLRRQLLIWRSFDEKTHEQYVGLLNGAQEKSIQAS
jgi:hypothetical protein